MSLNAETLQQMQDALTKSFSAPIADPRMPEGLAKSTFSQNASATSGLTFYDLELGAKFLYPVLTPLRNEIPRVSGKGGIQANWRAITAINSSGVRIGVSGGNRGAVIAVTEQDYTAAYKGIGLESNVDFEAQYAGQGFDDIRAIAARTGLEALMLGEEILLLGGNGSLALGTTPTPALAALTTGGACTDGTVRVVCYALTLEGFINASVVGGIQGAIVRTNADGSSDTFGGGSAQKSTAATITLSAGTSVQAVTATVAAVNGAMGYAWFWSDGASGTEALGAITTVNRVTITTDVGTGTQLNSSIPAADNSINNLVFDGLLTQVYKAGSNSYKRTLNGATLTADNSGGVIEIDTALKHFWDNYRLSPDCIWVNSQEALTISRLLAAGTGSTSNFRVNVDVRDGMIAGGIMVKEYLNRFSMAGGQVIPIRIHPNMPAGTILMTTSKLPYPLSNVTNVIQVRTRQDYYQIEWPLRSRKYEYGVYADEVLQHYFPPSMGVINNIGAA
jgi:hypothetical protein